MQSHFMKLIHDHIDKGINNVDGLSHQQRYQLTAAYLREASLAEQWQFITEPPGCAPLPQLLIEVIEQHKEEGDKERYVKFMLANTMAEAAVRWCQPAIEDGFSRAFLDREYWDNQDE